MHDWRHTPWQVTQFLILGGIAGMIGILLVAAMTEPAIPDWLPSAGLLSGLMFSVGGIMAWGYGLRFYFRLQTDHGICRSAVYLVIAVCGSWASLFIFMLLEGRDRFFSVIYPDAQPKPANKIR